MPSFLTPDGWQLSYSRHGDGPQKILMLMGFACDQRYWYPQVDLLLEMGRGKEHKASPPVVHTNVAFNLPHHECHRLVRHDFSPAPSHRSIRPVANTQSTATGSTASNKPADRYEIAVFDSRGFGKSGDTFFSRYSSRNMARDILAFLEHLGWVKSTWPGASEEDRQKLPVLHLVGWSMGGMILQELALLLVANPCSHLHRLTSNVFVSTTPGGLRWMHPEQFKLLPFSIPLPIPRNLPPLMGLVKIASTVFSITTSQRISRSMEFHYSPEFLRSHCVAHSDGQVISGIAHEVIAQLYKIRAPFDRFIFRYAYAVLGHLLTVFSHRCSPRRLAKLRESGIPALVVTGEKDVLVDPRNSVKLARELQCGLISYPDHGHMIHVECAYLFARALHDHMQYAADIESWRALSLDEKASTQASGSASPSESKRTTAGSTVSPSNSDTSLRIDTSSSDPSYTPNQIAPSPSLTPRPVHHPNPQSHQSQHKRVHVNTTLARQTSQSQSKQQHQNLPDLGSPAFSSLQPTPPSPAFPSLSGSGSTSGLSSPVSSFSLGPSHAHSNGHSHQGGQGQCDAGWEWDFIARIGSGSPSSPGLGLSGGASAAASSAHAHAGTPGSSPRFTAARAGSARGHKTFPKPASLSRQNSATKSHQQQRKRSVVTDFVVKQLVNLTFFMVTMITSAVATVTLWRLRLRAVLTKHVDQVRAWISSLLALYKRLLIGWITLPLTICSWLISLPRTAFRVLLKTAVYLLRPRGFCAARLRQVQEHRRHQDSPHPQQPHEQIVLG